MRKKVLILGSTGMLGHQVYIYFNKQQDYIICDISYRNKLHSDTIILDIKNKIQVEETIVNIDPDFIVNCIGVLIGGSKRDYENTVYINSYLPHQLVKIANKINAKLIHISTDCVFSGEKGKYVENDEKDGKDFYAKTKALGEIDDNFHLTIRTSIIGPELKDNGEGLFHWFSNQNGTINGYKQSIWSGVTTLELAQAIKWAMDENITGLYHITNGKSISKYKLLNLFKKETGKDLNILPVDGKVVDKSLIDTRKLINYEIPDYNIMVKNMIDSMRENKDFYKQYYVK